LISGLPLLECNVHDMEVRGAVFDGYAQAVVIIKEQLNNKNSSVSLA